MNYQSSPDAGHEIGALLTFACGAVAGAAVALIFAPTAGRDARAFLAQRSRGIVDRGRQIVIEQGRDKAFEVGRRIGEAVEHGMAGYRDAIHRGRVQTDGAMRDAGEAARTVRGAAMHAADA